MKLSVVLPITAIAQVSLADFYLFRVETGGDSGYQISDVYNPQCEELGNKTPWYPAKSDVSGKNLGITCSGNGCWGGQDSSLIDKMEMHFSNNPPYIWTILKSQNFDMVAPDGAKQGTCDEISGQAYSCPSNGGKIDQGNRKFHCKVYATAAQIKAAK